MTTGERFADPVRFWRSIARAPASGASRAERTAGDAPAPPARVGRRSCLATGGLLIALTAEFALRPHPLVAAVGAAARPARGPRARALAAGLAREIDALVDGEPGVYGIVVAPRGGDTLYTRNADVPFITASLYKLVVMAALHQARAVGILTLDEPILVDGSGWLTVGDALDAMITQSSNEAALALYFRLGDAAVNRAAASLGLDRTRLACDPTTLPGWPPLPAPDSPAGAIDQAVRFVLSSASLGWVNLTTPRDTATFFSLLLEGDVVNRRASARMLKLLMRQAVADRFPVLLPKTTVIAHKTGNLPGVIHDAGVIYTPTGPVVLAALAQDVPNEPRATAILQQLALIVYDAHRGNGSGRGWPAAPLIPRRIVPT